jgi:PIN domain
MAGPAKTTVHIFLDTNALFTEAADRLIAVELGEFILKSSENDLDTRWYIPSVVTGERRFQMFERAKRLLPQLDRVEKLLGHNLGITEDVLSTRVDDAIKRQIEAHKLNEVGFDQSIVDWQDMVRKSILRQPPFEGGESEKGFRDAIVLETFCQLVSDLPKSSQICRIILLSNDGRLVEAAQERMVERSNVTLAKDLDAVKTIMNALASKITQDAVSALLPRAFDLFFKPNEDKTLYYTSGIREKIRSTFAKELDGVPQGFDYVTTKAINIVTPPTFLIKEGQRLTFSTRIIFAWRR